LLLIRSVYSRDMRSSTLSFLSAAQAT